MDLWHLWYYGRAVRNGLLIGLALVAAFFAAMLLAKPVSSQSIPFPGPGATSVATYQGPGDIVSFIAWGSCSYAYTAAYGAAGSPACDLVDSATGLVTYTMNTLANGAADKAGAAASTACATACKVTKVYDQTGNGHHWTNATLAQMPTLTFNAIGTNPAITCVVSATQSLTSNSISLTAPWSVNAVAYRAGTANTVNGKIWGHNSNATAIAFTPSAATMSAAGSTPITVNPVADNAGHALQAIFNGASSNFIVDGTSNAGTMGTTANANATSILCNGGTPLGSNYHIGEIGPNTQSAYSSALRANVLARWGF